MAVMSLNTCIVSLVPCILNCKPTSVLQHKTNRMAYPVFDSVICIAVNVGGCDGYEKERSYYSQLGENMPKDTLVLTLGCGKYRLLDHDFGTLADTGLPRLMDMGQCNDAYSAVVVALVSSKFCVLVPRLLPL
jgi:hydroxylamine reductase (hybrid-cluster protein)